MDEPPFLADDPLAGGGGPWERRSGEFWNERFGASLSYEELVAGADPLAFFRHATELLAR